jgi:hypothetical protein
MTALLTGVVACSADRDTADTRVRIEEMECANRDAHAGQRECLGRLAVRTDAEILRLEALLRARITDRDALDAGMASYERDPLAWLAQDVASYRRHRETRCELWASSAVGGNGAGDMRLSCRARLDRERMRELQLLSQAFEP